MVSVPYLRTKRQHKREEVLLSSTTEDDFEALLVLGPPSQEEFARIRRNELEVKQAASTLKIRQRQDDGLWTPGEGESSTSSATAVAAGSRTPTDRTPLVIVTVTSVVDVTPTVTATVLEIPTTSTSVLLVSETNAPVTVLSTLTLGASSTTNVLSSAITPTVTGTAPSFAPQSTATNAPIFGGPSSGPAKVASTGTMGSSIIVVNSPTTKEDRQPLTTTALVASSEIVFGSSMTSQINLVSTASGASSAVATASSAVAASSSSSSESIFSVFAPTPSQVNLVSTASSSAPASSSSSATSSAASVASSSAAAVQSSAAPASSSSERLFSSTPSQVALVSTTSAASPSATSAAAASSSSSATSDKIFSTTQSQAAVVSTVPATTILSTITSALPTSATSAPVSSASAITDSSVFNTSGAQTAVVASLVSQVSSASAALSVLVASISSVSIASVSSVSSISAAVSQATVDSPKPGVVTSALPSGSSSKSGSKTKTSSSASATQTGAAGTTGESTATFFSQIGKSPVSITLTVLVCLGITAVLLGIAAFFVRRCHRRRRRAAVGTIILDSPDEKWDGEFAEDPFTDDGESAMDVLPGAVWARRGGPRGGGAIPAIQEYSPRDLQGAEGSPMTQRTGFTGFTTQRPSSDWTSIIGDHEYETEDERSKRNSTATDLLQVPGYSTRGGRRSSAPPMPPPHPLATSYIPDTPSAYSNATTSQADSESNHSSIDSESGERLLRNMAGMAATPPRHYNTFKNSPPILPNRSRQSWRLSLDRVMANAAEFVGAKALLEVDEDNYTEFAKTPRKAPPPPIKIMPASNPRDIPANFTPLSSSYSDRFAFSPDRPNSLPRFAIAPPTPLHAAAASLYPDPLPLRTERSGSDLSYLSAYYRREDGSSSQGHSSDAGGSRSSSNAGSQSGSPQLAAESMSRWGSAESGADTIQPIERDSDSDRSGLSDKSWQVVAPTSRNASKMNLLEEQPKLMMDPPLPPVAPLFSPAIPFSAQVQPPSALTRAATLESRRTYYSDGDDSQQALTVRANSVNSLRRASYDSGTTIGQRSPLPYLQHAVTGQRAQAHRSSVSTFGGRDSDVEGGSDEASESTESAYEEPSGAELDRLRRTSVVSELMLERRRKSDTPLPVFEKK